MANSVINENDGKLTEVEEKSSNPTEPTTVKIKGIFTSSSEISRSEKYELVLDRFRLYVNGKAFADNIISASASADYFVYVTREGRIRIISDENDTNEENNAITAAQVIAHPEKPVIWYMSPDRRIFEATLIHSEGCAPVFTYDNATGSICCRSYTKEYDNYEYRINTYNEITHFDTDKLSAQDCALEYLKNSGEIYNLFPDFDSYTPEMLTELKANRIRINSFDFKMRYEEQMNSQTPQSDWARCNDYADITLSFSVTGSKKGYRFLSEKKLRNGIPRGFLSFEDFIYNEYI